MVRPGKIGLTIALLLLTSGIASARTARIESRLNLRVGPGQEHRVLTVMPAGAEITVGECRGEWCRVSYRGQLGYASSALLGGGDAAYAAAPAPPAVATKYDADAEARVFQWNDREWRDRFWGELERQRRHR